MKKRAVLRSEWWNSLKVCSKQMRPHSIRLWQLISPFKSSHKHSFSHKESVQWLLQIQVNKTHRSLEKFYIRNKPKNFLKINFYPLLIKYTNRARPHFSSSAFRTSIWWYFGAFASFFGCSPHDGNDS